MALLDDLAKGAATPTGLAVGVGAALLTPVLAPAASQILRPAAKAVMRTGIVLYRSAMEPISAALGDLVAEAQLELATASPSPPAGDTAGAPERPAEAPHKTRRHKHRGGAHL